MDGMESETYDFKRPKINFSVSDLEETSENKDDPMFLPPAASYSPVMNLKKTLILMIF